MNRFIMVLLSLILMFPPLTYGKQITYPNLSGMGKSSIGFAVLSLALSKTENDYKLVVDAREANPSRILYMLEKQQIDVIDGGFSPDVAKNFELIYLPIDLGISGWRVNIIHKDNADKLREVNNIDTLKSFTFGQGQSWYDTVVLKSAGFTVITSPKLGTLINMIKVKRFDLLPLGANEVYRFMELLGNDSQDLVVDDAITIIYPFARFFYLRKNDVELKKAIEVGMEKAFADGSLLQLIKTHPFFRDAIERAQLNERTKFYIKTPNLTDGFKSIDPKWWFLP